MQTDQVEPMRARQPFLSHKYRILVSVIFGIFMVILDTTVVNVAFQTLRAEFGASLNDSQWIISIYVLAIGISTPLSAFLAGRYGMKRIYLVGLGIFILGSFFSGISPTLGFMIVARAFQGVGGGIALPLGTAILLRSFPAKEQGAALGIFGIASLVAPALGPILGGYLVDLHLWRFIFFINPPIGIIGIILGSFFLPEFKSEHWPALDWLVSRVRRLTGLEVSTEWQAAGRPPAQVELAAFRIAQEAVSNAVRHGRPPIRVTCRATPAALTMAIEDAGSHAAAAPAPAGERMRLGLLGMAQRAEQIGAHLEVRREAAAGTVVAFTWEEAAPA